MADAKHTPGKWVQDERGSVHVRAENGPYVADCNASAAIGWGDKLANARLISAAPDLLEALEAFPEDPNPYTYRLAHAKARAAIAKAKGES